MGQRERLVGELWPGGETGQRKVVGAPWVERWDRERGGWRTVGGETGQRKVVGAPWAER